MNPRHTSIAEEPPIPYRFPEMSCARPKSINHGSENLPTILSQTGCPHSSQRPCKAHQLASELLCPQLKHTPSAVAMSGGSGSAIQWVGFCSSGFSHRPSHSHSSPPWYEPVSIFQFPVEVSEIANKRTIFPDGTVSMDCHPARHFPLSIPRIPLSPQG
jgi:hypothetical protein